MVIGAPWSGKTIRKNSHNFIFEILQKYRIMTKFEKKSKKLTQKLAKTVDPKN